jgi:hypothetical protein
MFKIKQSTGKILLSKIRMIIYGQPKLGKTTLLSGWPDMLILAPEKGYGAVRADVTDITSWEQFKEVSAELRKRKKLKEKYHTLGIDTVDKLANLCDEYVCNEADIEHISDEKWGKGYARFKKEFEGEMIKLFMSNYGLIFVSHTKIAELSNFAGSIHKTVPTLNNQARGVLIPMVDIIGCMKIKTAKTPEGKFKTRRVLTFKPSELYEAGDRTGNLPDEVVLYKDAHKTYQLFKKAYENTKAPEK